MNRCNTAWISYSYGSAFLRNGRTYWDLQVAASTISAGLLSFSGCQSTRMEIYCSCRFHTLEVQEACSGSRSICALLAMTFVLGMTLEKKWRIRIALILAAPLVAIATNVIRIAGTGLIAWRFGAIAANESPALRVGHDRVYSRCWRATEFTGYCNGH